MKKHERVLVLGASGFIGSNLVQELIRQGFQVRAAGRNPEKLAQRFGDDVQCVRADVLKPDTLVDALACIDAVYYLVHGMTEGKGFEEREREGAEQFARVAEAVGVKRIVYLGALHPEGADSLHLRSRSATGTGLRRGTVPVTEIRAPIVIGPGSAAFEVMRDLVYNLPVMVTPKWVRSAMAPIALPNLLHYLVGVLSLPDDGDVSYDVAGPEMLNYQSQMQRFAAIVGKRVWIAPVPLLSPGLSARWLRFITSVPTGIARALVGGLKQDLPADDRAIRERLPQRLLGFDEAVKLALSAERQQVAAHDPAHAAVLKRRWRPQFGFYPKSDGASAHIDAPIERVWQEVCRIGGRPRYFALDLLWRVREAFDALIGGTGMDYYRRDPDRLRLGDRVDSWSVAELEPHRKLTLLFGMKAPGMGGLTFELVPDGNGTRLALTCWWYPAGAWGLMYWWAMLPAHIILFRRMVNNIRRLSMRPDDSGSLVRA
ncbi:SDR family oxidoreductase [Marinobacter hydrocarbonoclasticus]|nr:SDR family oxidoreductase [Marinobacter nauticus]